MPAGDADKPVEQESFLGHEGKKRAGATSGSKLPARALNVTFPNRKKYETHLELPHATPCTYFQKSKSCVTTLHATRSLTFTRHSKLQLIVHIDTTSPVTGQRSISLHQL